MGKLVYSFFSSLDGYITDEDGEFAWAEPDEEVHAFVNEIERELDLAFVRDLKERTERDISLGGPTLAAEAIRTGLVDEYHVFVVPVIVGGGNCDLFTDDAVTVIHQSSGGLLRRANATGRRRTARGCFPTGSSGDCRTCPGGLNRNLLSYLRPPNTPSVPAGELLTHRGVENYLRRYPRLM